MDILSHENNPIIGHFYERTWAHIFASNCTSSEDYKCHLYQTAYYGKGACPENELNAPQRVTYLGAILVQRLFVSMAVPQVVLLLATLLLVMLSLLRRRTRELILSLGSPPATDLCC